MARTITEDGTVSLEGYLHPPENYQEVINGLVKTISDITESGKVLGSEEEILRDAKEQVISFTIREKYPELDLSFLRMHRRININGAELDVPRFGVYDTFYNGFRVYFLRDKKSFFSRTYPAGVLFRYVNRFPDIFSEHLKYSTEFWRLSSGRTMKERFMSLPAEVKATYQALMGSCIESTFKAVIPAKTKRKLEEAEHLFNDDFLGYESSQGDLYEMIETHTVDPRIFFIAEILPEAWRRSTEVTEPIEVTRDPLAVGIYEEKAYLIDHFDTTPIEDYVRREFRV